MNKKIMFLMCLLMAMVWTAGCSCPGRGPWLRRPSRPWWTPAAAAAGPGASCPTRAGGARSFEEAEETRQLLKPRSDILRGNPG